MEDAKGKEDGSSQMEAITREILEIMSLTGMAGISISVDINTKANGRTIFPTEKDKHNTPMEVDITVNF
jgi:hypothetical protein